MGVTFLIQWIAKDSKTLGHSLVNVREVCESFKMFVSSLSWAHKHVKMCKPIKEGGLCIWSQVWSWTQLKLTWLGFQKSHHLSLIYFVIGCGNYIATTITKWESQNGFLELGHVMFSKVENLLTLCFQPMTPLSCSSYWNIFNIMFTKFLAHVTCTWGHKF
jgi:hypothetical protein